MSDREVSGLQQLTLVLMALTESFGSDQMLLEEKIGFVSTCGIMFQSLPKTGIEFARNGETETIAGKDYVN